MGMPVEFYVFEDDAGLGAEECTLSEGCPSCKKPSHGLGALASESVVN